MGTRDRLLDDTRRSARALETHGAPGEARYDPKMERAFDAGVVRPLARLCWQRQRGFLGPYTGAERNYLQQWAKCVRVMCCQPGNQGICITQADHQRSENVAIADIFLRLGPRRPFSLAKLVELFEVERLARVPVWLCDIDFCEVNVKLGGAAFERGSVAYEYRPSNVLIDQGPARA